MKYFLIAGEASGDLHGANLMHSIKTLDAHAAFDFYGGDLMQAQGGTLLKHYSEMAFMGFVEVLANLQTINQNLTACKAAILKAQPDVLVLIDYPGFNLRIAEWAKQKGIKVIYFIAPQVWAWKENRVPAMRKNIDRLLCILPFEKAYFKDRWNWDVDYVGHPLMQVLATQKNLPHPIPEIEGQNIIALLPGSRKQEILKKLPIMLSVANAFPNYQFGIAQAPGLDDDWFKQLVPSQNNIHIIKDNTYALLNHSKAALVTSGTATLETALLGVPEIVCYKGNPITLALAKRFVKIKFIALVNLIMNKEVVKELIQEELTTQNLVGALKDLLENPLKQAQIKEDYATLQNALYTGQNAAEVSAEIILKELSN
mgnify:CR=1 FL=1